MTTGLTYNRLRARTLRWLLKLAATNDLPMPKTIEFVHFLSPVNGQPLRSLTLTLDDENTDITRWAKAVDAEVIDEFEVTGQTHQWTAVRASTTWRSDGQGLDWHHIRVDTRLGYRPLADSPAVTA